ncbi:hypothetical protein ACFYY3_00940 [Streptomyces sp. NPDC001812]|uniref:hypothetical protein n=1 Tax=Streptomyces sp. NPDC001812 TaxID=3364611 RepID=UPI0036754AD5
MRANTVKAAMFGALQPTGRPHPLLTESTREYTAGPCPVYRDCTDTEPGHYDHFSHIKVLDTDGSEVLDAGMTALSGTDNQPVVYIRNTDYDDAASVHAATAKLRQLLDEVDRLADRVFSDHEKHDL